MSPDEVLVGSIAVIFAIGAAAAALGPWQGPYRLRTIAAVSRRFGKPWARGVWLAIAVASFGAGWAILNGIRPSYAVPAYRSHDGG